jgi:hypothetical protein
MPHPVLKAQLCVIKSEVISNDRNRRFNIFIRVALLIPLDSFNIPKNKKPHELMYDEWSG